MLIYGWSCSVFGWNRLLFGMCCCSGRFCAVWCWFLSLSKLFTMYKSILLQSLLLCSAWAWAVDECTSSSVLPWVISADLGEAGADDLAGGLSFASASFCKFSSDILDIFSFESFILLLLLFMYIVFLRLSLDPAFLFVSWFLKSSELFAFCFWLRRILASWLAISLSPSLDIVCILWSKTWFCQSMKSWAPAMS